MSVNVVGKDGVIITKKQDNHTQKTHKKQLKTKSIQQNSMSINVYDSCVRKCVTFLGQRVAKGHDYSFCMCLFPIHLCFNL